MDKVVDLWIMVLKQKPMISGESAAAASSSSTISSFSAAGCLLIIASPSVSVAEISFCHVNSC